MSLCIVNLLYTCIVFSQMCVFKVNVTKVMIDNHVTFNKRIKRRKRHSSIVQILSKRAVICLHLFESSMTIRFEITPSRRTAIEHSAI